MPRRMTDDEVEDYAYSKLFGDLDGIRSGSMFSSEGDGLGAPQTPAENAGTAGMAGIELSIKPLMQGTAESGRSPEGGKPEPESEDAETDDEDDERFKKIARMSPLMSRLHGSR